MPDEAIIPPDELRRRAEKCFRLAASLPPGPGADQLAIMGREYLEMAEKLEAPVILTITKAPEEGTWPQTGQARKLVGEHRRSCDRLRNTWTVRTVPQARAGVV